MVENLQQTHKKPPRFENFFQKLIFVNSRDYKEAKEMNNWFFFSKLWSKYAGKRVKLAQFACDLG